MNQSQINRIFIPFNKGKKKTRRRYNQQGCGLGLAISYKMAQGLMPKEWQGKKKAIEVKS
jgi:signal transduction histidine kinase